MLNDVVRSQVPRTYHTDINGFQEIAFITIAVYQILGQIIEVLLYCPGFPTAQSKWHFVAFTNFLQSLEFRLHFIMNI
jgi:hypothetical protein